MIPATKTHEIESTLEGEDIEMGFDAGARVHLMSMMIDMYSDPERAIIREYATNARDSHIAAGITDPIEIELPTMLRPTLIIRDHGVGLDVADIRAIYSQYGASTKRGSNDATGMLGIGCKSALTYADQFTVTGVKGGRKVIVSVSRDEDGAGKMKVLADEPTSEPSGVEITIPTKRGNSLARTAAAFFQFWPAGSVLVDGEAPAEFEGFDILGNGTLLAQEGDFHENFIVMGGVAYPCEWGLRGVSLVAHVPIGSVDFPPSREALQMTARTRAKIAELKKAFEKGATASVQREIDAAETRWDALKVLNQAGYLIRNAAKQDLRFKGGALTEWLKPAKQGADILVIGRSYYRAEGNHSRVQKVEAHTYGTRAPLVITNYTNAKWTAANRKRLDYYLTEVLDLTVNGEHTIVLSCDGFEDNSWVDPDKFVDWATLKAIKLPDHARSGGGVRTAGMYDAYDDNGFQRRRPADDIREAVDAGAPIFFSASSGIGQFERGLLAEAFPDVILVTMPSTRVAKFQRAFPEARAFGEGWKEAAAKWWSKLTKLDRRAFTYAQSRAFWRLDCSAINPDNFDDRALADEIRVAKRHDSLRTELSRFDGFLRQIPEDQRPKQAESVLPDYPLLTEGSSYTKHLTIYANAVFAARQNGVTV